MKTGTEGGCRFTLWRIFRGVNWGPVLFQVRLLFGEQVPLMRSQQVNLISHFQDNRGIPWMHDNVSRTHKGSWAPTLLSDYVQGDNTLVESFNYSGHKNCWAIAKWVALVSHTPRAEGSNSGSFVWQCMCSVMDGKPRQGVPHPCVSSCLACAPGLMWPRPAVTMNGWMNLRTF